MALSFFTIKNQLNIIMRNVDFMKNLVIKTIKLAKFNTPNSELNFEKIILHNEINNVVENNRLMINDRNIIIVNNVNRIIANGI